MSRSTSHKSRRQQAKREGRGPTQAQAIAGLLQEEERVKGLRGKRPTPKVSLPRLRWMKDADRIDGYDRDDLGESQDY